MTRLVYELFLLTLLILLLALQFLATEIPQ